MKMRTLLFGVILGFLAVVHSTPVNTVTQFPANSEDEVVREALTDGFLFDHTFLSSRTTELPKINATVQASPELSESKESDMVEGSAEGVASIKSTTSTFPMTLIVSHGPKSSTDMSGTLSPQSVYTSSSVPNEAQSSVIPDMELGSGLGPITSFSVTSSSTSTVLPTDTDLSSSSTSTTHSPLFGFTSSTKPNEYESSRTPDHGLVSEITELAVHSHEDEKMPRLYTATSVTTSSSSIERSTSMTFERAEGLDEVMKSESEQQRSVKAPQTTLPIVEDPEAVGDTPSNKGHSTPSWIIIVGFIAGVAALVMLCLAIATRDKWNGPKQVSQLKTKTNSKANQQREVEMETFMHKDEPMENGKAAEYTVIPLDELPEKYSSH